MRDRDQQFFEVVALAIASFVLAAVFTLISGSAWADGEEMDSYQASCQGMYRLLIDTEFTGMVPSQVLDAYEAMDCDENIPGNWERLSDEE